MSLEPRLRILREGGLLSDAEYQQVQKIIQYFREKHSFALAEANAAMFVTHLCAALHRINQGEAVQEMDAEVYACVTAEPVFAQALEMSRGIRELCPAVPDAEEKFLTVHICTMLLNSGSR